MKITRSSLLSGAKHAQGVAVIIDVFRAFSCTPLLFSLGIQSSIFVASPDQALKLKHQDPDLLLIGEIGGAPIEGFDFGNSPSQILNADPDTFSDRTVVQRTSSGVQGALAALDIANEVLVASYNVARATAEYIRARKPAVVNLVAMGWDLKKRAPEDDWCARYIAHLLGAGSYNHDEAMREIVFNETAQRFLGVDHPKFPPEDPVLCLQRDVYGYALAVRREKNTVAVQKAELT